MSAERVEIPIVHKVVAIQTVQLEGGGAVAYAILEDGSAIGGMHGVQVDLRSTGIPYGRASFVISGEVNP